MPRPLESRDSWHGAVVVGVEIRDVAEDLPFDFAQGLDGDELVCIGDIGLDFAA